MASGFAKPALSLSTGRFPPGLREKARAGFFYPLRRYCVPCILFLSLLSLLFSCGKDNPSKPRELGWTSLGFEDHWALEIELYWPYLYACAADDGLFRKRLDEASSEWAYLGLADTTLAESPFGHYRNRGVQDFAVLPDGTMLAAVVHGGICCPNILRSDDEGLTWARSDSLMPDTCIEPYALSGIYELECSPCKDGVVFAGSSNGVYRSADNGSTWNLVWGSNGGGFGIQDIQVHPQQCHLVWVGGATGWYIAVMAKSEDYGFEWTSTALLDIIPNSPAIYRIALDIEDADVAYLAVRGGVIKTADGGETWEFTGIDAPEGVHFLGLCVDQDAPDHLFAAGGKVVLESRDAGILFEKLESPIESLINDIEYDSKTSTLYVGTDSGVFSRRSR